MKSMIYPAVQKTMKPAIDIMSININAFEKLCANRTSMLFGLMKEGIKLSEQLTAPGGLKGALAAGKACSSKIKHDATLSFLDAKDILVEAKSKNFEVAKEAYTEAKEVVTTKAAEAKAQTLAMKESVTRRVKAKADQMTSIFSKSPDVEVEVSTKPAAAKKSKESKAVVS